MFLSGDPAAETAGLPFRLHNDLDIIAVNKEPLAFCELLHRLCSERGLVDVQLEHHVVQPKVWPAGSSMH